LDGCNYQSNTMSYNVDPFCPTSISIAQLGQEDLSKRFPTFKTGIGAVVEQQANPTTTNWDTTSIYEQVSTISNSCGAARTGNLCHYENWPFQVGFAPMAGGRLFDGTTVPALQNIFYDQNLVKGNSSMLDVLGITSCTASCNQWFYCGAIEVGNFTINMNFSKGTLGSGNTPVTNVFVNKY
jgi:hypothetical protein